MRADARRILVIAPGSLVEQWQDEMYEKFGLDFFIFSRAMKTPFYIRKPFTQEPDWVVTSIYLDIASLLKKASKQEGL